MAKLFCVFNDFFSNGVSSSSLRPFLSATVSLSYADGSTSADLFLLPSQKAPPLDFSSPSPTALGLLGMNQGPLSLIIQTFIRRFSYCILAAADAARVLLHETNLIFSPHLKYTPLFQMSLPLPFFNRFTYSIQLDRIRVFGELLPIPKSIRMEKEKPERERMELCRRKKPLNERGG